MTEFNAVECPLDGINLVEAAAGTGKTYNIETLVLRAVLELGNNEDGNGDKAPGFSIQNLLLVTFTNAAASEMKGRVFKALGKAISTMSAYVDGGDWEQIPDDVYEREKKVLRHAIDAGKTPEDCLRRLRAAAGDFDKAQISTIHGFCHRILLDFSFERGGLADMEILQSDRDLIARMAEDHYRKMLLDRSAWGDAAFVPMDANSFIYRITKLVEDPKLMLIVSGEVPPNDLESAKREFIAAYEQLVETPTEPEWDELMCFMKTSASLYGKDSISEHLAALKARRNPICADLEEFDYFTEGEYLSMMNGKHKKTWMAKFDGDVRKPVAATMRTVEKMQWLRRLICGATIVKAAAEIRRKLAESKLIARQMSNNDLIQMAAESMTTNPRFAECVSGKYRFGIIDEFQDTDPTQCDILTKMFVERSDRPLFMVGDPRQAIYAFRGCDLDSYLDFAERHASRRYTLSRNFRSSDTLVEKFNDFFHRHNNPFMTTGFSLPELGSSNKRKCVLLARNDRGDFAEDPQPLKFADCDNVEAMAADAVTEILTSGKFGLEENKDGQMTRRAVRPGDFAVLVRNWREADEIKRLLSLRGIPAAHYKRRSVFATPEAKTLYTYLNAVVHDNDAKSAADACRGEIPGRGIFKLRDATEETKNAIMTMFAKLLDTWRKESFTAMMDLALERNDVHRRWSRLPDGGQKLANIELLCDILRENELRHRIAPDETLKFLGRSMENAEFLVDTYPEPPADAADQVVLTTIHSSKGLQYNIVINAGLTAMSKNKGGDKEFLSEELKRQVLDIVPDGTAQAKVMLSNFQEKLRLAYVSLTRATAMSLILMKELTSPTSVLYWLTTSCRDIPVGSFEESKFLETIKETKGQLGLGLPPEWRIVIGDGSEKRYRAESFDGTLQKREYDANPDRDWKTCSFSSLALHSAGRLPGREDDEQNPEDEMMPTNQFPRLSGTVFGSMLHELLEKLDFNAGHDEIKLKVLQDHNYGDLSDEEAEHVTGMLVNTLDADLGGFRVKDIPDTCRRSEMEFTFALKKEFDASDIQELLGLEKESRRVSGGFLTGSIDLMFKQDDKFHIVDWKSNLLASYDAPHLEVAMRDNQYEMQLAIYMVALIKFLKLRTGRPNFNENDYDRLCGGAHYVFMRGVDQDDPQAGVYTSKPDFGLLRKLEAMFE
ncbi:MAG: UvrD-helicase domain-containing protein [Victivallaceae bacterium]|nr:UvrD-helicase domain-containing protein [Victivallaceae bacterium]